MKKNQDKRRLSGKVALRQAEESSVPKPANAVKKSSLYQITLVPFNLRSKF